MNAILSIKPEYAHQILNKTKKVEFRKVEFKQAVNKIYIYCSAPEKSIVGYFTVREIVKDNPTNLWKRFSKIGGIEKDAFFAYYGDKKEGVTFCIDEVFKFSNSIEPLTRIKNFTPPQSFRYLDESLES